MVDAQAVDAALAHEAEDRLVRAGEDLGFLDAQPGEAVDVEEAAIVDVARRDAPMGEPVGLRLEDAMQRPEALRDAGGAVDEVDGALDRNPQAGRARRG